MYDQQEVNSSAYFFPLTKKQTIAQNTLELTFDCSLSDYSYESGQYAYVTLPDKGLTDATRIFSFATPPDGRNLTIVARIRPESEYKQSLAALVIGEHVHFSKALGFFSLPRNTTIPIVMIAGGVGIVPFRSLIESHQPHSLPPTWLFVSNQTSKSGVYIKEITHYPSLYPTLTLNKRYTQGKKPSPHLTAVEITAIVPNWAKAYYYLSGTPHMVDDLSYDLHKLGVPLAAIHQEAFTGY